MSYEDYENKQVKEKRIIQLWAGGIIALLSIALVTVTARDKYLIYKNAPQLDQEFLSKDVCFAGFDSIVSRAGAGVFVEKEYLSAIEDENYSMIDFDLSKENYRQIEMINKNVCKIIIKDQSTSGHGLRAFKISLVHSKNFDFNHKVSNIAEVILDESDLRWR